MGREENVRGVAGGSGSGLEEKWFSRCCWRSIKKCNGRPDVKRGNLEVTDAGMEEDGTTCYSRRKEIKEFSFGQSFGNHQISLRHRWIFGWGGENVYIRDPDLYRAAWLLALPNPMNRVLVLIYPKHQISLLL